MGLSSDGELIWSFVVLILTMVKHFSVGFCGCKSLKRVVKAIFVNCELLLLFSVKCEMTFQSL